MCVEMTGLRIKSTYTSAHRWHLLFSRAVLCVGFCFSFTSTSAQVTELPPDVKLAPKQDGNASKSAAGKNAAKAALQKQGESEASRVKDAERSANLKTCFDGRYPVLCKHSLLTSAERSQVEIAEKRANYAMCIDGRYPVLCKHSWLTGEQSGKVLSAEKRENLRVCLDGRYSALCNHSLLNQADGTIKQLFFCKFPGSGFGLL